MDNKVLLILGASSDIGRCCIEQLWQEFDYIIAHYNQSADAFCELSKQIGDKLILRQADFSNIEDVEKFINNIKETGLYPTHIVHLPANRVENKKFHNKNTDDFSTAFQIQVLSIQKILSSFLPNMAKKKYGKIVLMLSSCTVGNPPAYWGDYVTVKYALLGLMKSLAVEYTKKGININGISPSMIETKFLSCIPDLIIQQNASEHPLGRNAQCTDIVPAIKFLLDDQSSYISGHNLIVSGGSVI